MYLFVYLPGISLIKEKQIKTRQENTNFTLEGIN